MPAPWLQPAYTIPPALSPCQQDQMEGGGGVNLLDCPDFFWICPGRQGLSAGAWPPTGKEGQVLPAPRPVLRSRGTLGAHLHAKAFAPPEGGSPSTAWGSKHRAQREGRNLGAPGAVWKRWGHVCTAAPAHCTSAVCGRPTWKLSACS